MKKQLSLQLSEQEPARNEDLTSSRMQLEVGFDPLLSPQMPSSQRLDNPRVFPSSLDLHNSSSKVSFDLVTSNDISLFVFRRAGAALCDESATRNGSPSTGKRPTLPCRRMTINIFDQLVR